MRNCGEGPESDRPTVALGGRNPQGRNLGRAGPERAEVNISDVLELRTDDRGFTVLDELGTVRVGWADVVDVRVGPFTIELMLEDGRAITYTAERWRAHEVGALARMVHDRRDAAAPDAPAREALASVGRLREG
jgi:hypothetical protein